MCIKLIKRGITKFPYAKVFHSFVSSITILFVLFPSDFAIAKNNKVEAANIPWDGRDILGNFVADGTYTFQLDIITITKGDIIS